jgi:uncharacterized protein involved in tolerance to divalent cations
MPTSKPWESSDDESPERVAERALAAWLNVVAKSSFCWAVEVEDATEVGGFCNSAKVWVISGRLTALMLIRHPPRP